MPPLVVIPIGSVFHRMTVISAPIPGNRSYYLCRCECGREKIVRGIALRFGKMKSCGCQKHPRPTTCKYGHVGEWKAREYKLWLGMKARCYNPNKAQYKDYGGRGIVVCERWRDSYANFLSDMGRRPSPKHTLDRIDNDGPYSPENCRWATRLQQQNNRTDSRFLTLGAERHTISEWSRILNVDVKRFFNHLRTRDWDLASTIDAMKRKGLIQELPSIA